MMLVTLLGFCATLMPAAANSFRVDKSKEQAELLQGEWVVVALGYAGFELQTTAEQPMRFTFSKDRMLTNLAFDVGGGRRLWLGSQGFSAETIITFTFSTRGQEATFKLDATKTPAQIDIQEKKGKDVSLSSGIYRLKGNELELCIGQSSRPTEFKASTGTALFRLKRVPRMD